MQKQSMRKRMTRTLCLFLAVCLLASFGGALSAAAEQSASARPIRVGFFAFAGYHNQDEEGNRSGYGYEYLQQMARYTGWTYEYVGYDRSWNDAQRMLENGEIDLLTSAQKTPEREEIFDFSSDPIGYSSTIFTIKAGDDRFAIDDFATFEGIRVGMIEGNSRNADFADFAAQNGFAYKTVYFRSTGELVEALQKSQIDAIVTSSLRVTDGEWVVAEFAFSPYYVCVQKGNQALLDQVNEAIGRLNQDNPSLQNQLENKYYSTDTDQEVAFTQEERDYIARMKAEGRTLRVTVNPDRAPLSYYENGQMRGILGEVAQRILERGGLPYEVIVPADRAEYERLREEHGVDLCMDMRFDYNLGETMHYRPTDSYISANISRITKKETAGEIGSVAAVAGSDIAYKLVRQVVPDAEVVYYASAADCVQAVREGSQDAAYLYTYAAEKMLENELPHQLTSTLVPDFSTEFCVGVGDMEDAVLFSILNKCVASIDAQWVDQRVLAYTQSSGAETSLTALIYYHPMVALALLAVVLVLAGAVVVLQLQQKARAKDAERAREIQRLFGYVCRTNESVLEVDLGTMRCKEFSLQDGGIRVQEAPYQSETEPDPRMAPAHLTELIQAGGEEVFETQVMGADGVSHWYIYTVHGMRSEPSQPGGFMLFKRNIDDLKEKEEASRKALKDALRVAKEASEAKGTFMSRMSHEIRTPLNAVIGYLTLMQDCLTEPEKVEDYVNKCQSAARHLLSIINDVLDISAIESGKIKIASDRFDLKELLSTLSLMFYSQAKKREIDFRVDVEALTQEVVIGDQLRLNQILMNLLSNAMKFTPAQGSVHLTVTQLSDEGEQVRMRFVVADTGIGMSPEFMARIFSPFEQEKAETARKYGGSGLGLSITSNLITMMHGRIRVDSKEGAGSTFTVHLAFQKVEQTKGNHVRRNDFMGVRALIVDDEKSSCESMKALLKRCGVKSDTVLSGKAAVRQIQKREGTDYAYDLCLMDWNMPEMDGVETARQIRRECSSQLPIIIATAYDLSEIRDEALEAGVNRLIPKPLFQSAMFDLLVDTFGKYEPMPENGAQQEQRNFTGVRVLLAEDNPMNMEIAVSILKKSGLLIDTAQNGQEACEKFNASAPGTYQLILMDVQMPILDGYEATRAIRAGSHPQAKTIPILAMTANAFTEDINAALSSGMNGHISKPVNYDKLYHLLNRFLGQNAAGTVAEQT